MSRFIRFWIAGDPSQAGSALALAASLLLSACAGSAPQQRWAGTVAPEGATGPGSGMLCQGITDGELVLRGTQFQFAPNAGTLVLAGSEAPDGRLAASLTLPGANHQGFIIAFTGMRQGDRIEGVLTSPECRATVALRRVPEGGILQRVHAR